MHNNQPVVMSGPSGGGKSTLLNRLMKEYPESFAFSVSHTTREPRSGEVEGQDYYFVSKETFIDMKNNGKFLEHAQFSGNMYGTSKDAVLSIQKTGRICVLDVEINGVKSIKKSDLNAIYIFIKPPDMDTLKKRLEGRGTETEESLNKRLATAKEALDYADIPGNYNHVIINDKLDVAYEKLKGILIAGIHATQSDKLKAGK